MVTQTLNTSEPADRSNAVKLFHDYVILIQDYEEQEINLAQVASRFHKDVGCTLVAFLGKYSSYEGLDEFTNWFYGNRVSNTEVRIKAKSGRATLIPSANIVSVIKAKVDEQHTGVQMPRPAVPVCIPKSWEDYFRTNDVNCFLGVIEVKPSVENPGNTWIRLKECHDATGRIADYSFACKDEKVSGVEDGSLVLGRRNQLLPDRPFFFAGDRIPVELVDWKELKIEGSAREFLERSHGKLHVDCECYFRDLLVVDNDRIYSGIQYSRKTGEVYVGEECREGNVCQFLSESKQMCWMYLLEWGSDKGLFRLIAPKDGSGMTTNELISRVGTLLIKTAEEPSPSELRSRGGFGGNDGGIQSESVSVGGDVLPDGDALDVQEDSHNVITKEEILKVCAEVLQDGVWHNREDLLKELNQRIPCMSASGVSDSDIYDGLRGFSNVDLRDSEVGNWSAKIKKIKEEDGCGVAWNKDEQLFFDGLRALSNGCGYSYTDADLVRFHTSFKCSRMVILGGAPGVGKSSLVRLYAAYIGGKADSPYLAVAVNPAWVEPADLLGSKDFAGEFQNPACGLAKFMRAAEGDGKNIYPVCFEEMNLACAEHYFSDFMQAVSAPLKYENEKEKNEYVVIEGYDEAGFKDKSSSPLKVVSNLRIVGTCNFDVTTHPFSPRFYDRCAYIELGADIKDFPERLPTLDLKKLAECKWDGAGRGSAECLNGWLNDGGTISQDVTDEFKSLLTYLGNVDLLPSPRIAFQMKRYILSRPPFDGAFRNEQELQHVALDEALAQYDLAKYMPATNEELREMQTQLKGVLSENKFSYSIRLIEAIEKRFGGFAVS